MLNAELITIGDEILYGQIVDTNSQWIAEQLSGLGIKVIRKTSIGDVADDIKSALDEAFNRSSIVLMTGGLGPTKDDITKETLAEYFGVEMKFHQHVYDEVAAYFASRGREITETNKSQSFLPANAKPIRNNFGTAPGMWIEHKGSVLISMPGVPFEMKALMTESMLPNISKYFKLPAIYHKVIKLVGIGESYVADMIAEWEDNLPSHIKLAYLPSVGTLRLRITALGSDKIQLQNEVESLFIPLKSIIGKYIFGYEVDTLEGIIGQMLLEKNATISTAESCTGGYLSHLITSIPGSSAYYKGSVISYANEVKVQELSVSESSLNSYGAVSEEVIIQMAENSKKKFYTTYALATSGVAGPDGGSEDKPVGTVWIALAHPTGVLTKKLKLGKLRMNNIHLSAISALDMLRLFLNGDIS
ncbi:MAG: Nicotinamide-nucleotide amidase [Bacteroidota bacterium]|jgi:nicotinamide-nucleotide amidase